MALPLVYQGLHIFSSSSYDRYNRIKYFVGQPFGVALSKAKALRYE